MASYLPWEKVFISIEGDPEFRITTCDNGTTSNDTELYACGKVPYAISKGNLAGTGTVTMTKIARDKLAAKLLVYGGLIEATGLVITIVHSAPGSAGLPTAISTEIIKDVTFNADDIRRSQGDPEIYVTLPFKFIPPVETISVPYGPASSVNEFVTFPPQFPV